MNFKKLSLCAFLCIFLLAALTIPVLADMGPKPQLTVKVENAPDELYYLDLLSKDDTRHENLNEDDRRQYNQNMLSLLEEFNDNGWQAAIATGTNAPLWGNIEPIKSGEHMSHTFAYFGLPQTYRIIIVTESGNVSVTKEQQLRVLQSSIVYDYETGELSSPSIFPAYILQFLSTCIPTLLIEGLILLLFRYRLRENFKVFFITNIATQIFLTVSLGSLLIFNGSLAGYFFLLPLEAIITLAEALIYKKHLKGKSARRNIIYAVCANGASLLAGFLFMENQYKFLSSLL